MQISKKLVLLSIFAVLALPLVGAVDASAQNVLVNGDFETGDFTGWEVAGGNADATATVVGTDNGPSMPGMYNAFMNNLGEAIGLTLKQPTAVGSVSAGIIYYSYDLKLDMADVGGVLFVEIFAEQEGVGIIGGSGLIGPLWPWEWTHYEDTFEAPAGTDFLTIQFMANTGAAEGSTCVAHVDNVYLGMDGHPVAAESMTWGSTKALYR